RKESRDIAGRCAMLLWTVWNNRNNSVWNAAKETGRCLGAKRIISGLNGRPFSITTEPTRR
ncbi:hypothetical protein L195_g047747, partial [Trifolium pratense]